jgi:peroxiredoxin Q/BCP
MKLKKGATAPNFKLPDANGKVHSLSEYKGKWLLMYFYPRDNTPGCTKEACSFRDNFSKLKRAVEIVGVSGDSVKSHKNFSEKYSLPFTLLADPEKAIIKKYGTEGIIFAKRTSFLINPKGVIEKIYEKVNPSTHAEEIINDLAELGLEV